ncbi:MAG: GNAT family N-acetyltransferase [Sandaracinaceae bacterium]
MTGIQYEDGAPPVEDVLPLYAAVGWTNYVRGPERLARALLGSRYVTVARRGGDIVGLARTVSDEASVWFLQDLLVHPEEQGKGVGAALLRRCAATHEDVPRGVLLTDREGPVQFYEKQGWAEEPRLRTLLRAVRVEG